jgi:hypothetical protein
VWTLSSDLSKWKKTSEYNVGNIWENETHQAGGMPKIAPSFPVLSMHEDGVVYLIFTDVVVGYTLDYKGQYLLRVDMGNNKIQFFPVSTNPGSTNWIHSPLMASDFSAYQQVSRDHPVLILSPKKIHLHSTVNLLFTVTKHTFACIVLLVYT